MNGETPLTFSLPNAVDEGNCALALIHFLVERHNAFAQLIDEYLLTESRMKVVAPPQRAGAISSRFVSAAHTIRCDLQQDVLPLLEKHCFLQEGKEANQKYDFAKAERLLIEHFLVGLPVVDLEVPGFTFKNEQHLKGC